MNFPAIINDDEMSTHIKEWEISGFAVMASSTGPGLVEIRNHESIAKMTVIEVDTRHYPPRARYVRSGDSWMLVHLR